ncbi:MAG: ribonuclease HI [Treponema sp.]|nr:ribonuclease HI [Treponema sp.]
MENENTNGNDIVIYTDGGCSGNPGPGGWGCVILYDNKEIQKSGGEATTTNNKMELSAVIAAFSYIAQTPELHDRPITVCIDSQYVKNGITAWIKNWKKNGWKTADKKPVKNQELWIQLDTLTSQLPITWKWVKGHAGIKYNEICDSLCQTEIKKFL